jgi:uncharacterized protein involved in exopolysaccharide biosynthesis/Mrp family chromosome partitioning ATPase
MDGFGATYGNGGAESDFLPKTLAKLRRHGVFITSFTLLLSGVLGVGIQFLPKTYEGVASVEVQSQTPQAVSRDIVSGDQVFTDETAGTELGIFKSHELQIAVIRKLNLLQVPEFNPDLKPDAYSLDKLLGQLAASPIGQFLPADWMPAQNVVTDEKATYDTLQTFNKLVKVTPVTHSKIIQITASSHDRVLAAKVANAVALEYIATHLRLKAEAYDQAHNFTDKRVPELRQLMVEKTAAVDRFREKNGLVSGQYGAILRERLTEATKNLVDARAALQRAQASLDVSKKANPLSVPEVIASQTIRDLRLEESKVAEEGAYAGTTYQARWGTKQAAVEARINEEARRIIASLPQTVLAARANVETQTQAVLELQTEVGVMETAQSQLASLQNDAALATKQYNDFATRALETNPDVAYTAVNVRLLSAAVVPYKASFPNNLIVMPVVFILSFSVMAGIALMQERRVGFRSVDELRDRFDLEVIGRIPLRRTGARSQIYDNAIEELCTRAFPPFKLGTRKTILVTSVWPDEGKTTIANALAKAAAARGVSVVVVGADLRMAQKGWAGKAMPDQGLGEVLRNKASLGDVLVRVDGVDVIPAGVAMANPTHLLALPTLPALIKQLQETYAFVIIDSPPAGVGGDTWSLSHFAEEVLLVVKYGDTADEDVMSSFPSIHAARKDIKVVLNMMPIGGAAHDEIAYSARMLSHYKPQKAIH